MLSISRTISRKALTILICLSTISLTCFGQSNNLPSRNKKHNIYDEIKSLKYGIISLKYSQKHRKIWLENKQHKIFKIVHIINRNANPEIVGAEGQIKFVSRSTINNNNNELFGLTFSERSMQGRGDGECGSGAEEYFVAYKVNNKNIVTEIFKKLINSCIERIDLDTGDGNNNDESVTSLKSTVTFRWLTYPNTDLYKVGTYDFIKNTISYSEYNRSQVPKPP